MIKLKIFTVKSVDACRSILIKKALADVNIWVATEKPKILSISHISYIEGFAIHTQVEGFEVFYTL